MNQLRGMIDQPHSLRLAQPAPLAAGDERNSQRVKTGINARFSKYVVDASVLLGGKLARNGSAILFQAGKDRSQLRVNGNGEEFPRIVRVTLRVLQADSARTQVDVLHWNRRFRKPTASVEADFKGRSHPFRFLSQFCSQLFNILIRQLRLNLLRASRDAESGNGVGFRKVPPNSLGHKLGEKLHFEKCGVMSSRSRTDLIDQAPRNVIGSMLVTDLTRINDVAGSQERFNGLPRHSVTSLGTAFAFPMGFEIAGHPYSECTAIAGCADAAFIYRNLFSAALGLARVAIAIVSEAGRFFFPNIGIEIASAQIPVWRAWMLAKACHRSAIVSQGLYFGKWNRVAGSGSLRSAVAVSVLHKATVTLRGNVNRSNSTDNGGSLTQVSQGATSDSATVAQKGGQS